MPLVSFFFSSSLSRYTFTTFIEYSTHSTQIQRRHSLLLVIGWLAKELGIICNDLSIITSIVIAGWGLNWSFFKLALLLKCSK